MDKVNKIARGLKKQLDAITGSGDNCDKEIILELTQELDEAINEFAKGECQKIHEERPEGE
jgi:hypothetical protein